jgi:hypothetical protein
MAALCAVAVTLALLSLSGTRTRGLLVQQYRTQLSQAAPEQVSDLLEAVAALGTEGMPLLVEAVCSHSDEQVVAADRLLRAQLDRWQTLPPGVARDNVAHMASLLARHARGGSAESKRRTAELCTLLLLWSWEPSDETALDVIADCETVLRARLDVSAEVRRRASEAALADSRENRSDATSPAQPVPAAESGGASRHQLALPDVEPDPAIAVDMPGETPATDAPLPSASAEESETYISLNAPRSTADSRSRPIFPSRNSEPADEPLTPVRSGRWLEPAPLKPEILNGPASRAPAAAPAWESATDCEIMRRLLDEDPRAVEAAASELRQRGYTPLRIELAKQLVSPDPRVRLALVETLLRTGAFDPRLWLIWLTRDEDPAVRRAAIAVIATSNDPALRAQLEACEQEESDPEVLRFVRRVRAGQRAQ